jgi:hypothetical protein
MQPREGKCVGGMGPPLLATSPPFHSSQVTPPEEKLKRERE